MKISPSAGSPNVVIAKTTDLKDQKQAYRWWLAKDKKELSQQVISTFAYLKETQNYRQRQAAIFARLYGNMSLFNFVGSSISKMEQAQGLPTDRPTFNIVQSCIDTLVSRISQSKPAPVFLTDNSDYKERNLAKKLNNFILGEFYQTKAYEKSVTALRDALIEGTGCLKVYETPDHKVALDRVLLTELYVDTNESVHGDPRQLFQVKLIDRDVLKELTGKDKLVEDADEAYPDSSTDSSKSIADLVMVVEAWHLPSGKDSGDGRHTITCSAGTLLDEKYDKDKFPFVFMHFSPRMLGFWAQGLSEQLMGTQLEINSLLFTISKAIKLVGVPRVFVEEGSKVVSSHLNNDVGAIVKYRGTKPIYEVAECVPQELYAQLQRLIDYGYQQSGVSALQASSQKPAGLNSGEAIRSYDDISSDRFQSLSRRYDNLFIDLAYLVIDKAKEIAEEQGEYQSVYPGKDGTKMVDLPKASLLKNPFVIQCFNMSSLPRDPAGRLQKVTEMMQAGMISIKEGRRLLDFPDLNQVEKLANASEERIFQILDEIVEEGNFTPPDPFMDLQFAKETVVQYINLYSGAKLEEEKAQLLRDFYTQILTLDAVAQGTMGGGMQPGPQQPSLNPPQAQPEPLPQSPLVPNANVG